MYDLILNLISHSWNSQGNSTEQQVIFYISGSLIILFTVVVIDLFYRFIRNIFKGGR